MIQKGLKEKARQNNMDQKLKDIQTHGISSLKKLSEETLSKMLLKANETYYNDEEIIADSIYDILKEYIQTHFPNNMAIKMIGAPVKKNKTKLPYEMWSMDKIKPDTGAMERWKAKYPGNKVISGKLDGVSGLYSTEGGTPKLYTRGNGKIGQDISHIIPFLKLPMTPNIAIRGEFIIKRDTFEEKYEGTAANARSFVSGTINLKTPDYAKYADINFVAYEVINPVLSPSDQMVWLENQNVLTVVNSVHNTVSNEILSEYLQILRVEYEYETDGLIVCDDKIYPRISENPKHAFAFKMVLSDQMAEAKVLDIHWTPSKDGILKPRVQFEPVTINGATLQFASGYNAKFIQDNNIGIGTIIEVIRSGDVIPKIIGCWNPDDIITKMPECDWVWNETEVDAIMPDHNSSVIVKQKQITRFFTKLEVEGLSSGTIAQLMESGFDTIKKILEMDKQDFLSCDGFQDKKATKIYKNIKKSVKNCSLTRLMAASNLMGRGMGERRSNMVLNQFPDILTSTISDTDKIKLISGIDGFAEKTAELFVEQIPKFMEFIYETELEYKLKPIKKQKQKSDKIFVFTGFRPSKDVLEKINLGKSINKNTTALVVKDLTSTSGKIKKAKKLNIPLLTMEQFTAQYL